MFRVEGHRRLYLPASDAEVFDGLVIEAIVRVAELRREVVTTHIRPNSHLRANSNQAHTANTSQA